MSHTTLALAIASLSVLASASPARAQRADAALDVRLDTAAGVAAGPFLAMDLPRVEGSGAALVLAIRMRVHAALDVGVRVPLAATYIQQPAGSYVSESAWGNPEVFVEHAHAFALPRPLLVRARLALGAPLAEHGAGGFMEHRALAVADALLAWRDRELFVPGVVPLTPAVELALPSRRWSAYATLKLPLLVAVTDATPDGSSNALGITSVVGLGARVGITSRLHVAGGAHAAFELVRPLEWIERGSRVQPSAHVELDWRIHGSFSLGVRCIVPVAGPLGGDTFSAGLSIAHTR